MSDVFVLLKKALAVSAENSPLVIVPLMFAFKPLPFNMPISHRVSEKNSAKCLSVSAKGDVTALAELPIIQIITKIIISF